MAALIFRKRGWVFATASTKHQFIRSFSTEALSPSAASKEQKRIPPKKVSKGGKGPFVLAKSRSSRYAEATAHPPLPETLEQPKRPKTEKKKKVKKKKKIESPIPEALTPAKPLHSDLPFAFRWSYTEIPAVKPIAYQEKYSPFGPGRLDRTWTGEEAVPVQDATIQKRKQKEQRESRKKKVIDSFNPPPAKKGMKPVEPPGPFLPGTGPIKAKTREEILGEPLTKEEMDMLLQRSFKSEKQINLGRDGLTHNMVITFFNYWTRVRVIRVKCKGVATVDMDNVVYQIEDKTGGKVIYRAGGTLHVFRGRNYNNKDRPNIPPMLWRPHSPIYPKLVVDRAGGLKLQHANALRKRGRELLPLCKLAKNGYYGDLVASIRDAFEDDDLVRIDCTALERKDYKKIGAKLRDLVPCILISFQGDHILCFRSRDYKKPEIEAICDAYNLEGKGNQAEVTDGVNEDVVRKDGGGPDDGSEDTGVSSGVDVSGADGSDLEMDVDGLSDGCVDGDNDVGQDGDASSDAETWLTSEDTDAVSDFDEVSSEETEALSGFDDLTCEDTDGEGGHSEGVPIAAKRGR